MPTVRQCDVPPDVWAKLLAAADEPRSATLPPQLALPIEDHRPALVAPVFAPPGTWLVPIATHSEANGRNWKARSARTQAARLAVSRALGPHLDAAAVFALHNHAGGALALVFTRLGGRRLDRSNLPVALKATEDAVALMLGADDGDPRWQVAFEQEMGGAVGVRVELRAA